MAAYIAIMSICLRLLRLAKLNGIDKVFVHAFLGRPRCRSANGSDYIEKTETVMQELGVGKFATISGRYYAMDRDKRWERVEKAYHAIADGDSTNSGNTDSGSGCYRMSTAFMMNLSFRSSLKNLANRLQQWKMGMQLCSLISVLTGRFSYHVHLRMLRLMVLTRGDEQVHRLEVCDVYTL